ncbi:hypothetical protein, partial [Lawsonibacter hominis]|uniref:hypothetical protein n=1 Tax=Lawsonibacter hominis TaxID=2763053 RepID=UPI001A9B5F2B
HLEYVVAINSLFIVDLLNKVNNDLLAFLYKIDVYFWLLCCYNKSATEESAARRKDTPSYLRPSAPLCRLSRGD